MKELPQTDANSGTYEELTTLKRRSYNLKYSQQFPFKAISRLPTGKSLLSAQRLWRDGVALFDRLGLPDSFEITELEAILEGATLKEKENIFDLCGEALLIEKRAADTDITDIFLLKGIYDYGVKCSSFHAHIVGAFCNEFLFLNGLTKTHSSIIREIEGCYVKALGLEADPRAAAMSASFRCLVEEPAAKEEEDPFKDTISQFKLAMESFEHRLPTYKPKWDEGSLKFEIYYLLATVLFKKIIITLTVKKHTVKATPAKIKDLLSDYRLCLELFLKKAPQCHWYVPMANFMLSTEWLRRKTPPTGAKVTEILKRNPDDVKRCIDLFDNGIESMKILVKWNPVEQVEAKPGFDEALKLQELLKQHGYRKTDIPSYPVSNVELKEAVEEDELSWRQWLRWNLTDPRNIQILYLFAFVGLMMDPLFKMLGFFISGEE